MYYLIMDTVIKYYLNGKKFTEVTYVDGKRHGPATMWDENGDVKKQELFQYDTLQK